MLKTRFLSFEFRSFVLVSDFVLWYSDLAVFYHLHNFALFLNNPKCHQRERNVP